MKILKYMNKVCLILCVLLFSSCSRNYKIFKLNSSLKENAKIAVISGSSNQIDMTIAEKITKELQGNTSINVTSTNEITSKVSQYPLDIVDFKMTERDEVSTDYLTEYSKETLRRIQNKLKVDYILLVWGEKAKKVTEITVSNHGSSIDIYSGISIFTRLVNSSNSEVKGYSYFSWRRSGSGNETMKKIIKEASNAFSKEVGSQTETIKR